MRLKNLKVIKRRILSMILGKKKIKKKKIVVLTLSLFFF